MNEVKLTGPTKVTYRYDPFENVHFGYITFILDQSIIFFYTKEDAFSILEDARKGGIISRLNMVKTQKFISRSFQRHKIPRSKDKAPFFDITEICERRLTSFPEFIFFKK